MQHHTAQRAASRHTSPVRLAIALIGVLALALTVLPVTPAAAQDGTDLDLDASDPLDTALVYNQLQFPDGGVDDVVLTTSEDGADALASGSLVDDAAFLYYSGAIEQRHLDEIERLGATNVIIVGGTARIPESVETELMDAGLTVDRLAGDARIETANAVTAYEESTDPDVRTDAIHLTRAFGDSDPDQAFADAAGLGAWAAQSGVVSVLTDTDTVTTATADFYAANDDVTLSVAIGGTAAVSDDVLSTLETDFAQETRRTFSAENDNRAGTAVAINDARGLSEPDALQGVIFVDGYADDFFIDAYALAGLAGTADYAVVLTDGDTLPPETEAYLTAQSVTADLDIIASPNVTDAAIDEIETATGATLAPFGTDTDTPAAGESFTDAPELVSVAMESVNDDDVDLRFTFDEAVTGREPVAECFHLYSTDMTAFSGGDAAANCDGTDDASGGHAGDDNTNPVSLDGGVAQVATDDTSAVIVNFDLDASEMDSLTLATVDWDAVMDVDGLENLEGALPFGDATVSVGTTTAPDLIDVGDFNADTDTVEFFFDEDVSDVLTNPAGLLLITDDGDVLTADTAQRSDSAGQEAVVMATFTTDGIDTTTEASTVRAAALAGSVTEDADGTAVNATQTVDVAADGTTTDPDLISVDIDLDEDTATYTFDESVTLDGAATAFQVYDTDAVETDATAVVRGTDDTTVVASFTEDTLDEATGASVDAAAVTSATGTDDSANEVDEVAVMGETVAAGATTAPDLTGIAVVTTDDLGTQVVVEFTFDEDIAVPGDDAPIGGGILDPIIGGGDDPTAAIAADATRFFVYDADGMPTRGSEAQVDPEDANVVQVVFGDDSDNTIADAVTATVNDLAVADSDGNANAEAHGGPLS